MVLALPEDWRLRENFVKNKMKTNLKVYLFVSAIVLPVAGFLGLCFAWYADSYAAFSGAIG